MEKNQSSQNKPATKISKQKSKKVLVFVVVLTGITVLVAVYFGYKLYKTTQEKTKKQQAEKQQQEEAKKTLGDPFFTSKPEVVKQQTENKQ